MVAVDGDGGERGGGVVRVHAVGFEEVLSELKGGAVEDEPGVGGGLVGEVEGQADVGGRRICWLGRKLAHRGGARTSAVSASATGKAGVDGES